MPDADRAPAIPAHDFREGETIVACARCGDAHWDVLTFGACRDAEDMSPGGGVHIEDGEETLCGRPPRPPAGAARVWRPCAECFAAIRDLPRLGRPHDFRVAGDGIACADCGLTGPPPRGPGFPCDGRVFFAAMRKHPGFFGPPGHLRGCRYRPVRDDYFPPLPRVTCRYCMRGLARAPRAPLP